MVDPGRSARWTDEHGLLVVHVAPAGGEQPWWYQVGLTGELDLCSAPALERVADYLADSGEAVPVVVDLSGLTFLDSAGVGALLSIEHRLRPRPLSVSGVSRLAGKVIALVDRPARLRLQPREPSAGEL